MTNEEAKAALLSGEPVMCDGIEYLCIEALRYKRGYDRYVNRSAGKRIIVFAELLDKNGGCLVIAKVEDVKAIKG